MDEPLLNTSFPGKESKDPNRDDIPSGLLRQRRNLILISLTLLFIYYSGVNIQTASLSIFGAELTLDNPKVFDDFIIIWIAWGYFIWRYTQYIRFYGVMTDIGSEYRQFIEPLHNKKFLNLLMREFPEKFEGNPSVHPLNIRFSIFSGYRYVSAGYIDQEYSKSAYVKKLSITQGLLNSLEAFLKLIVSSRHVSDYWLPYIIAMSPVAYIWLIRSS